MSDADRPQINSFRQKVAQQLALEDESRSLGVDRYRQQRPLPWREATASTKEEAELAPGRQLIKQVVPTVAEGITEFLERLEAGGAGRRPAAAKLLSVVDPEVAAYLAARVVVNSAANQLTFQATALAISEALVHHVEMLNLKSNNKKGYKGLLKAQQKRGYSSKKRDALLDLTKKEGAAHVITSSDRLQTGGKVIELVCDLTGLFVVEACAQERWSRSICRSSSAPGAGPPRRAAGT